MIQQKLFEQISLNIDHVVTRDTQKGLFLWDEFLKLHPADSADFLDSCDPAVLKKLFTHLPLDTKITLFEYLSHQTKTVCLSMVQDQERSLLLSSLPLDDLTDFFDELSEHELKKYTKLLRKHEREQVLSLLKFKPDSAGGVMDIEVLSLLEEYTVEKSITILQRLQPNRDLHQQIFITNRTLQLVGYINLEDLVLKSSQAKLGSIMHKNELVVSVDEDREIVAQNMIHYHITIAPVVDAHGIFLGAIPSDTLVDIIEQEATENMYRMSALSPIKHSYFETPFLSLLYQRISILTVLLLAQSLSTSIMQRYEAVLGTFLVFFLPMLTSTGGNTSGQTSALVIQGLASGDINNSNRDRFFKREFLMSLCIALALGAVAFVRIMFVHGDLYTSCIVSSTLIFIVLTAVILGSSMPFVLKKLNLDPAASSGPFLGTLMDILGVIIYCLIITVFLR